MNQNKLFIPILLGTVRDGRYSEFVATRLARIVKKNDSVETEIIDVRELDLPMTDEGTSLADKNKKYKTTMAKADGLIIVSPEYNHGYSGSLKRALDVLYDEYNHKAVGVCAVSMGGFGGARMTESLISVLKALGFSLTKNDLNIMNVQQVFSEGGETTDEKFDGRAARFISEVVWLAQALKWGRENLQ